MTMSCSAVSANAQERLWATAPTARAWLIIEAPGAWGRNAVAQCDLPEPIGAQLLERAKDTGTTVLVARRPGRTAELTGTRRIWLAHTSPGGVSMRSGELANPFDLLDLDLAAMARGEGAAIGARTTEPALFICANSKRDACCALEGGPLARELAGTELGQHIWECSHLGGHRFAATALLLPWGTVHGRLSKSSVAELFAALVTNQLPIANYRGRSALPRPFQAAEIAVRAEFDITGIDVLDVLSVKGDVAIPLSTSIATPFVDEVTAEVRATDGRAWRVQVVPTPIAPRIESCQGDPVPGVHWHATSLSPVADWMHY